MIKKYNDSPVQPEKINLIQSLLNDPVVSEFYKAWTNLRMNDPIQIPKIIDARNEAFLKYCEVRDKFLGLPPLQIVPMQGTQNRFK